MEETRYRTTQLGAVLKAQGRRQDWLAAQLGLSQSQVSRIIAGTQTIDAERAKRTALLLGAPLFLLFDFPEGNNSIRNGKDQAEGVAA